MALPFEPNFADELPVQAPPPPLPAGGVSRDIIEGLVALMFQVSGALTAAAGLGILWEPAAGLVLLGLAFMVIGFRTAA